MPKKKINADNFYKYETTEIEAKYKIFMNSDQEKRAELYQRVKDNNGYCPSREGNLEVNRCMCEQFKNRDSEGFCKCRLYFKEERSAKQMEAYMNAAIKVDEKRERELEKQMTKEEKAKEKELADV